MTGRDPGALELSAGVPGWTLRVLIGLVAAAIITVLLGHGLGGAAVLLLVLSALTSVVMPASPAPALLVTVVAMAVVAIDADPFGPTVLVLIPLVHLLHVACGIAGLVPARSRVHLAALRVPAVRFAGIQAGVFALAGLLALLPAGRSVAFLEFLAIVGVAAIALLILWLLVRRSR
jgi:hypothetical protein